MMYKETSTFIKHLKAYRNCITKHQYKTLKGKAIQGDTMAARKGLVTILSKQDMNISLGR